MIFQDTKIIVFNREAHMPDGKNGIENKNVLEIWQDNSL